MQMWSQLYRSLLAEGSNSAAAEGASVRPSPPPSSKRLMWDLLPPGQRPAPGLQGPAAAPAEAAAAPPAAVAPGQAEVAAAAADVPADATAGASVAGGQQQGAAGPPAQQDPLYPSRVLPGSWGLALRKLLW
jgi:hypothetical protein